MNVKVLLWVLIGLTTAVLVVGVVAVNILMQQQRQAAYESCLAVRGFTPETARGADLDALVAAADECSTYR